MAGPNKSFESVSTEKASIGPNGEAQLQIVNGKLAVKK